MISEFSFLCVLYVLAFVQAGDVSHKDSLTKRSESKLKLANTEMLTKPQKESAKLSGIFDSEAMAELPLTTPSDVANYTLEEDHHVYYNSTFYSDPERSSLYWVDLSKNLGANRRTLPNSYRQASTVNLSFPFPFYGSVLTNVTIATGGFLYTGDYLHNWIAATQYIAPLMANFDTSLSPSSDIMYVDNGTALTVQWDKVFLHDKSDDGPFTFQTTLLKNGDIIFAYKEVPSPVTNISDAQHPVKVGLSDAYILQKDVFFMHKKTIYEYHKIDMTKKEISNNTALYFVALPTCSMQKDCLSCLASDSNRSCKWCDAVGRCSDGFDRLRQNWLVSGCTVQKEASCAAQIPAASTEKSSSTLPSSSSSTNPVSSSSRGIEISTSSSFPTKETSSPSSTSANRERLPPEAHRIQEEQSLQSGGVSPGAIATIVVFLVSLLGVTVWVFYAYKYPQTPSGQFLIKYRPSQWVSKKDNASFQTRHT